MSKFNKRTTAPSKNNKYYYEDNIFYKSGYGMPNCTCYAWGRFYELSGTRPKLCTANAENWYKYNDGYERGKTPKLGAVIVWSKGKVGKSSDGAGHVAVVEEIKKDGSIVCSNSAWKSTNFYLTTHKKGYKKSGYNFEGFIYNPVEFEEPKDTIEEDGIWGKDTTIKAQKVFGTTVDGIVSNQYKIYKDKNAGLSSSTFEWEDKPSENGSSLIKTIQKKVGTRVDGYIGDNTIKAMQKWLGTTQDGYVSRPSNMVKAFQKWLNNQ